MTYLKLDVRRWHRESRLSVGTVFWWVQMSGGRPCTAVRVQVEYFSLGLEFSHFHGTEMFVEISEPVWLDWTPCHYGKKRPWFICPGCERRVAILFIARGFRCRHCLNLAYESQQRSGTTRFLYTAEKIREKLGGSGCIADDFPAKPKGMHWRTYRRLRVKAVRYESRFLGSIAKG